MEPFDDPFYEEIGDELFSDYEEDEEAQQLREFRDIFERLEIERGEKMPEDRPVTSDLDPTPSQENAGTKLEADLSLDNDSDANSCRFLSLDTAVHFIDRSFDPQFPTMLKAESDGKTGPLEEKAAPTEPAEKKEGG